MKGHIGDVLENKIVYDAATTSGRVAQILVIEMNLGAPRAGFARGVFGL
jgi:hypothetical protein